MQFIVIIISKQTIRNSFFDQACSQKFIPTSRSFFFCANHNLFNTPVLLVAMEYTLKDIGYQVLKNLRAGQRTKNNFRNLNTSIILLDSSFEHVPHDFLEQLCTLRVEIAIKGEKLDGINGSITQGSSANGWHFAIVVVFLAFLKSGFVVEIEVRTYSFDFVLVVVGWAEGNKKCLKSFDLEVLLMDYCYFGFEIAYAKYFIRKEILFWLFWSGLIHVGNNLCWRMLWRSNLLCIFVIRLPLLSK